MQHMLNADSLHNRVTSKAYLAGWITLNAERLHWKGISTGLTVLKRHSFCTVRSINILVNKITSYDSKHGANILSKQDTELVTGSQQKQHCVSNKVSPTFLTVTW